ncbi:FtsX-like permease family protein [Roseivirga sp. E12]|uniref:FtsX-like permease family protein n=1 Tax=Roseivirga sp. E12 TaxID=2819237 RepID=UPI001ABC49F6|nr:FtsX-like permease family protein [Roseivirga sp. E12]MBO3697368.1 ABC transporter permease [Roseivirga sp. E12]
MRPKKRRPPIWADKFLRWYCADQFFEEVQGDLHEWFYIRVAEQGIRKARIMYFIDVIRYFRTFRLKTTTKVNNNSNYLFMKNLVKLTFRNLRRNGFFAALRIGNLAIGILVFLLVVIYASYELGYDKFHEDHERVYRISHGISGNPWAASPVGLGPFIMDNSTSVASMTRVFPVGENWFKKDDITFKERNGHFADSAFFDVFTHSVIQGDLKSSLIQRNAIVLTADLAQKYFGKENPIGQTLKSGQDDGKERVVTAVIENVPEQSHLQFDYLLPMSTFNERFSRAWRNLMAYTYIKGRPGADFSDMKEVVLKEYTTRYGGRGGNPDEAEILMVPISQIHLKTNYEKELADNGSINYVYILLSVGIFVLLISCINFINLSVIKGLDRGKEVGLRKTIGASKNQVRAQFIGENFIVIFISELLAVISLSALSTIFRNFSGLDLPLNALESLNVLGLIGLLIIGLTLICGLYPAVVLGKFKPAYILKTGGQGGLRLGRLGLLRKGLIILQFGISLVLIICSMLIYNQLDFIQNKDSGLAEDEVLVIPLSNDVRSKFQAFKNGLEEVLGIKSVTTSSHIPGYRIMVEGLKEVGIEREGSNLTTRLLLVDNDFVDSYGLEVLEGRDFLEDVPDKAVEYLINESAVNYLFEDRDPLTRKLIWKGDTGRVVGIVKDFHFESLHNTVEPLVMSSNTRWSYASVRFDPKRKESVMAGIASLSNEVYPDLPSVEYEFLEDRFETLYLAERKLKSIVWSFCLISIVLTISGIFGMATYIAKTKTREIAIRKVLGGNTSHLFGLMSKGFVQLLVIGTFIGVPSAIYLTRWWLRGFAYRVPIGVGIFVLASAGIFLLVLGSSGYVTLKTAKSSPTDALKSE